MHICSFSSTKPPAASPCWRFRSQQGFAPDKPITPIRPSFAQREGAVLHYVPGAGPSVSMRSDPFTRSLLVFTILSGSSRRSCRSCIPLMQSLNCVQTQVLMDFCCVCPARQPSASQPCALFCRMKQGEPQGLFGRNSHVLRTPWVKSAAAGPRTASNANCPVATVLPRR